MQSSRFCVLLLLLASCLPVLPPRETVPDTANWTLVNADDRFTMLLPKGMSEKDVQGIDSFVGEWEGEGLGLNFDYGWYSDPLDQNDARMNYSSQNISLGGAPARLVQWIEPIGMHVTGVNVFVQEDGQENVTLTLAVWYQNATLASDAKAIVESIRLGNSSERIP